MLMDDFRRNAKGFLFIGDPHAASHKIGRRKDDYTSSVLGKLEAAAFVCEAESLIPVILGDLLHTNDDSEIKFLNRLFRVLKQFPTVPLVLEGNHDRGQLTCLSDQDVLQLLSQTGTVEMTGHGLVGEFLFEGALKPVRLWAVPHGKEIPDALPPFDGQTVMVTHHDLAFGSTYPGAIELKAVKGCDMVVNGHMHDTKKSVHHGDTWWHNPGNIEPLSIDLAGHIPRVWKWAPGQDVSALEGIDLPHAADIFDLAGLLVKASEADEAVRDLPEAESQFVKLLMDHAESEAGKTEDRSVLMDDLHAVLEAQNAPDAVRKLILAVTSSAALPDAA